MRNRIGKALTAVLSVALCFMLVMGVVEVIGMAGGPAVTAQVLGSDGGGGDSGGGSSGGGGSTTPTKKSNPISVKGKTVSLSGTTLKKKKVTVAKKKILKVSSAKGTVRYKLTKASKSKKYFSINKKTGKLTVKKGLKAGTYKLTIRVTAYGNSSYKQGSDTATVKIKVSKAKVDPTPEPEPTPEPTPDEGTDNGGTEDVNTR